MMYSLKGGKKWKASWQIDCEQNLVSGGDFHRLTHHYIIFLLDVSQLPPWWLIMQSCLSIAELRERVWNPKEQLRQVNVHRKYVIFASGADCSHLHVHSSQQWRSSSHLHGRDGVASERLARCQGVKTLLPFPQLWCTRPPDEVASSTHQLSHQLEQAKRNDFSSIY